MKLAYHSRFALAAFVLLLLPACLAKRSDVLEGTSQTINAVSEAREYLSKEHVDMMTKDIEALKRTVEEGDKRFRELQTEAARKFAEQKALEASIERVVVDLGDKVTGGMLSTVRDAFDARVKSVADQTAADVQRMAKRNDDLDTRLSSTTTAVAAANTDLSVIRATVSALSAETREKLSSIDLASIESLKTDLANPERFKERVNALLIQAEVSDKDRGKILDLSPAEIMAILTAAGGSTFLARKLSPSAGQQKEIDQLWERQEAEAKNTLLLRSQLAATPGSPTRIPQASIQGEVS